MRNTSPCEQARLCSRKLVRHCGSIGAWCSALTPILDNNCMAITADGRVAQLEFLYRFMTTVDLSPFAIATTVPSVRRRDVEGVELCLPPLPEQQRIVAKIDSLSAKSKRVRDHLEHIPRLVEKCKQAILAAAFQGDLTKEWRGSRLLPDPPPARLRDLLAAPIRNGLSVRGSDEPPGVRSLRLSALRSGCADLDDVRYLPISDERASRFLLQEGMSWSAGGTARRRLSGSLRLSDASTSPQSFPTRHFGCGWTGAARDQLGWPIFGTRNRCVARLSRQPALRRASGR